MKIVNEEALEAAGGGNIDTLRQLDTNSLTDKLCDSLGCTCLHYAARQGGADMLHFLVKERNFVGYKRSNVGATAAHDAAAAGNLEALQWLIKNGGCNVDDQDGTGATILHLAARFHHTRIAEWLLDEAEADSSKRTASNGLALHFAVVGGDYDAVKLLLDDDRSSVNLQLSSGATATYLAAQEGHIEILRLLIQDYRGNVKVKSYDGMSCIHAAAQSGHLDCVRFLVDEEKCNANDRDFDGATPLHYAASQGRALVIDWLMKMGGARVTLDNLGGSPLHNAAETDQQDCIKVLINNGCSVEITDNNGLTAAELARKCHNQKCADLIETFKPQSQFVIDEDIAYLNSVQSPRPSGPSRPPAVANGYGEVHVTHSHHSRPEPAHNGVIINGAHDDHAVTRVPVETVIRVQSESSGRQSLIRVASPVSYTHGNRQPIVNGGLRIDIEQKDETSSVSAHADSVELPIGIPRKFSEDWSVEARQNLKNTSPSASSSSLSSLSHLDEAVAIATQEVEKDKITQNASVYRKSESHVLPRAINQRLTLESKPVTSLTSEDRKADSKSGLTILGPKETKSVSFQAKADYINNSASKFSMKMEESNDQMKPRNKSDNFEIIKPLISNTVVTENNEKVNSNGLDEDGLEKDKTEDGGNSGSVTFSQNVTNVYAHTAPQNTRSHVTNLEMLRDYTHEFVDGKPTPPAVSDLCELESTHALVNGTDASDSDMPMSDNALLIQSNSPTTSSPPPPPPVPTIPSTRPAHTINSEIESMSTITFNAPQILGYGNQNSVPAPPPVPPIQQPPIYNNQIETALLSSQPETQLGSGNQTAYVAPHAPSGKGNQSAFVAPPAPSGIGNPPSTVPPPPPPPPIEAGSQLGTAAAGHSISDEIKRKSASLPARPVGIFTAVMIQSQRSTLTPAKTQAALANSSSSDFITELKQATKGPALRKTSKSAEPGQKPLTPAMTFIAGHKTVPKSNSSGQSKDTKTELTGEWDPKNFIDQVPNKDDLPVWKVQLQARQIAEKTMKETLEKRKVEEHESRFKGMPAWKRALLEKKETEARAVEEKHLQEQEESKKRVVTKRIPNVNVTANSGEEGKLAPWQRELQKR